ncbi:MAG TPA: phospholipase D-like domain-containing protein [Thermoanaerobaculia bacterium]|nr:phospholipase D-like domain-containing protein [Thermoanaerobaculia bacterium]
MPRSLRPSAAAAAAAALPGGLADPAFVELLSRIDEGTFHPGNRVEVFFRGDDAFGAMLSAVRAAREEVLLESYIFKDDATGDAFARELCDAALRGVRVRVLADGFGSFETKRRFWGWMRESGVQARLFHPIGFPPRWLMFRDHRKILVADRRVAFTGGMNIGEEYGASSPSAKPRPGGWRDTHACVEGPAAREMALVFEESWLRAGGERIGIQEAEEDLGAPGARVMILDSRPGRGSVETASVLSAIVAGARRRIWITMAYFAPRTRAARYLGRAARRGVDVRMILPGKTDVTLVRHAGHGFYASLLAAGVRIFEYQAAVLHAKTMVADGLFSVIGSSNYDFRSFELNAECNFVVRDAATAAVMEGRFEKDLASSDEILKLPWRKRSGWHRSFDALARRMAPIL